MKGTRTGNNYRSFGVVCYGAFPKMLILWKFKLVVCFPMNFRTGMILKAVYEI